MKKIFLTFAILLIMTGVAVADSVGHVVISEVQIAGVNTTDDFIELFNPTSEQINLKGYRLVKRAKTGTTDTSIKSWTSDTFIPAYGHYLWANSDLAETIGADTSTSTTIADDNGIALRIGAADTGEIIDSLGWGACQNIFVETAAFATNPVAGKSLARQFSAHNEILDTDDNSADFAIIDAPTPQNSASDPVVPTDSDSSANHAPDVPTDFAPTVTTNSVQLSAIFSDSDSDTGTLEFLFFTATPTECSNSDENFRESGSSNLIVSGSRGEWTPTVEIPDGEYFWCVRATDEHGDRSAFSAAQNFTLDTTAPGEVSDFAADGGTGSIELNWVAPNSDDFTG
ncbi:MAG: lamin tail domain-containing protein, partial [Patescibacteria group bacterium]